LDKPSYSVKATYILFLLNRLIHKPIAIAARVYTSVHVFIGMS